jgi:translation initiation factor 2B subunit (eIF-2B alpha/beta/delta family)
MDSLDGRVAQIAADHHSGASELVAQVLSVLTDALASGAPLRPLAVSLVNAQPSMAPVWNAVRAALAAGAAADFERYVEHARRAPRSLVRHAAGLLLTGSSAPLALVTISFSGTVALLLETLLVARPLHVACADGLPGLEGRRMTARLAAAGIQVSHFTDAGLGHALDAADAIVVGADAVTPDWFLNKSGTRMLAAAAAQQGIPVYVLATRDKFLSRGAAALLEVLEESPSEVWPTPPAGVTVRNPYFEATTLDLVSAVISEVGVLGASLVPDACPSAGDEILMGLRGTSA